MAEVANINSLRLQLTSISASSSLHLGPLLNAHRLEPISAVLMPPFHISNAGDSIGTRVSDHPTIALCMDSCKSSWKPCCLHFRLQARCCCHGVKRNLCGNPLASIPTCRHTAAGMVSNAVHLSRAQRLKGQMLTDVAASRGWCGKSAWIATTW
eukprot:1161712-Pelagomonas_calceolata.AAC.4